MGSSGLNPSLKMLSRLATKALAPFGRSLFSTTAAPKAYVEPWDDPERNFVQLQKTAVAATGPAPPGKPDAYLDPWENPERDYVNFPTRRVTEVNPAVRHFIWPETFFQSLLQQNRSHRSLRFCRRCPNLSLVQGNLGY